MKKLLIPTLIALLVFTNIVFAAVNNGAVSHWALNETSGGKLSDALGYADMNASNGNATGVGKISPLLNGNNSFNASNLYNFKLNMSVNDKPLFKSPNFSIAMSFFGNSFNSGDMWGDMNWLCPTGAGNDGWQWDTDGTPNMRFIIGGSVVFTVTNTATRLNATTSNTLGISRSPSNITAYINGVQVASAGANSYNIPNGANCRLSFMAYGRGDGKMNERVDQILYYNETLTASDHLAIHRNYTEGVFYPFVVSSAPPVVNNMTFNISTVNHTTAINNANKTIWRTNQLYESITYDYTPTITFNSTIATNCSVAIDNVNYTTMNARSNSTYCNELNSFGHTCTFNFTLPATIKKVYVSCSHYQNATSSSQGLGINLIPFADITFTSRTNASDTTWYKRGNITVETNNTNLNDYSYSCISIYNAGINLLDRNCTTNGGNIANLRIGNLTEGQYYAQGDSFNSTNAYLNSTAFRTFWIYNFTQATFVNPINNTRINYNVTNYEINISNGTFFPLGSEAFVNFSRRNITLMNSTRGAISFLTITPNSSFMWKVNNSLLIPNRFYILQVTINDSKNNRMLSEVWINITNISSLPAPTFITGIIIYENGTVKNSTGGILLGFNVSSWTNAQSIFNFSNNTLDIYNATFIISGCGRWLSNMSVNGTNFVYDEVHNRTEPFQNCIQNQIDANVSIRFINGSAKIVYFNFERNESAGVPTLAYVVGGASALGGLAVYGYRRVNRR